jgi:hypothetical protein
MPKQYEQLCDRKLYNFKHDDCDKVMCIIKELKYRNQDT